MKSSKAKIDFSGLYRKYGIFIIFLILFVTSALINKYFLKPQNLINILKQISVITIIACAETMLIVSGMIDLSAGLVCTTSACFSAGILAATGSVPLAIGAGIAIGCGLGAAFLATGLPHILPLAAALVITPLFVPDWRSRNALLALACAALVFVPWLVTWPALLYARSPELFAAWLHQANLAALAQTPRPMSAAHALGTLCTIR